MLLVLQVDPMEDEEVLDLLRNVIYVMEAPERDVSIVHVDYHRLSS
jgi:hypothetical protein